VFQDDAISGRASSTKEELTPSILRPKYRSQAILSIEKYISSPSLFARRHSQYKVATFESHKNKSYVAMRFNQKSKGYLKIASGC
jgi:hypothetical protein